MKINQFILVLILLACKENENSVSKTDVANDSGIWIDVRSKVEYDQGHRQDAIHIPYDEITNRIQDYASNKETVIHLYCASGGRSAVAMQRLKAIGYTQVINEGGLENIKTP